MKKHDIEEHLEEWITEHKYNEYSNNTLKKYRTSILIFIEWLNEDEIITKDTTINYKKYLTTRSDSINSINDWIVILNKYLKWLGLEDTTIKCIKKQQKQSNEDVLTIADYKRLLRIAKRMDNVQLYLIMKILAMTGIRISELRYFTIDSIKSNYINVYNKGKDRRIIVRQDLARELRKYARENKIKEGYLFPSTRKKNTQINESTIFRQMKRVAGIARVNKSKVHAHSFRHLFAQIFLTTYSDNITELADILGHNSLETTRIYTRTSDYEKKNKLERMKY